MGYWKTKVLPKIKKVFDKSSGKKLAAAEACKSFDGSKDEIGKEFEEKKTELQPKVIEIYEASSTEIKTVVKEPNEAGVKKNSAAVQKFIDELVKIDFPGSKLVSEASTKFGPVLVSGPVFFIFEKVSTFIVTEDKEVKTETKAEPSSEKEVETETTPETSKEKEVVVEEEKEKQKEEEKAQVHEVAKVEEEPPKP